MAPAQSLLINHDFALGKFESLNSKKEIERGMFYIFSIVTRLEVL